MVQYIADTISASQFGDDLKTDERLTLDGGRTTTTHTNIDNGRTCTSTTLKKIAKHFDIPDISIDELFAC